MTGTGEVVLRAEGVVKRYGGLTAVNDASIAVRRGQIAGLIGPNGAGKSTLMRALTGEERLQGGHVFVEDQDVTGWAPHRITRLGVGRSYQSARLMLRLSVLENLMLAPYPQTGESLFTALFRRGAVRKGEEERYERAVRVLETVELSDKLHEKAGSLSGGQRRLVELARLMMADVSVALLDEPTAGLSPIMISALEDTLRLLVSRNIGILVVEHNMGIVSRMCSWVSVMRLGQVMAEGPFDLVSNDAAVKEAYLGA